MRQVFFLVGTLILCASAFSQECTTSVVVNVFDDRLRLDIQTLTTQDFQARMGDTPLTIVNSQQGYNSRLLVLVEAEGTNKDRKLNDVLETVTRMTKQAPEGKPVAFGLYSDKAVFTHDFVTDPRERTKEINGVIEEADTLGKRVAMYDALYQALQMFGEHQPGDTILLVAGPYDDKSEHSLGDVEKEFLATGTRLMAMLRRPMSRVGSGDFVLNSHEQEKSLFLDFAERTGGAHSEFDPHFFGFTWRGYMLDVKLPDHVRKPHNWSLKVPGLRDGLFKHIFVFYPELLQPCRATEADGKH